MLENAEITNAKEYDYTLSTVEERDTINYGAQKAKAIIKKDWEIENFPFDKQDLKVIIESGDKDTSELIFVNDTINSLLDENVDLKGWKIESFNTNAGVRNYKTNYGDPAIKEHQNGFATFEFNIKIKRESWGLFIKLFSGVYIAFAISMMVFFMGPENAERFGIASL